MSTPWQANLRRYRLVSVRRRSLEMSIVCFALVFTSCTGGNPHPKGSFSGRNVADILLISELDSSGFPAGLWSVSTAGSIESRLSRSWRPVASNSNGAVIADKLDPQHPSLSRYAVIDSKESILLPGTAPLSPCASWARGGTEFAYLTGSLVEHTDPRLATGIS